MKPSLTLVAVILLLSAAMINGQEKEGAVAPEKPDVEKMEKSSFAIFIMADGTTVIIDNKAGEEAPVAEVKLAFSPNTCIPLAEKTTYVHEDHAHYFKFDEAPEGDFSLYTLQQVHFEGPWTLDGITTVCIHTHVVLVDAKKGKMVNQGFVGEKREVQIGPVPPPARIKFPVLPETI